MQELEIIRSFIARVRAHVVRRRLGEAAVFAGAALLVWLFAALVAAPWLPDTVAVRAVLWGVLAVSVGALVWLTFGRAVRELRDERQLARDIERATPSLRNDLVSALQFGGQLRTDGVRDGTSTALVRAHLRATARETERYRGRTEELFGRRDLRQPARFAALVATLLLLVSVTFPAVFQRAASVLFGADLATALQAVSQDEAEQELPRTALLRDVRIQLRYPAYTQMRPRRLRPMRAHVPALKVLRGTEVRVDARLVVPAVGATIVLESDEGTRTERAGEVHGERLEGSFVALESGTWRVILETEEGASIDRDVSRHLEVQPDTAPVASIEEPSGVVEVTEREVVKLRLSAIDDFGLTEIALVTGFEGVPESQKRRVVATVEHQSSWAGEVQLDLGELDLEPKDVLTVRAAAVDNDEVSNPKEGLSPPLLLRVASPEDRHEALLEREQEMLDALIGLLADYLERPVLADEPGQLAADEGPPDEPADDDLGAVVEDARDVAEARYRVLSEMGEIVDQMQADELMMTRDVELVRSLHETLYERHRNAGRALDRMAMLARGGQLVDTGIVAFARDHRMPQVRATERAIILLEELITAQWLDAAQMTVNQIREIRDRLQQLLEDYQKTADPQLKAEILTEIERLQKRIDELLSRLSRQVQNVPSEHMNVDAGSGDSQSSGAQEMQNLAQSAEKIRQMLESGDIQGALDALEQLDSGLQGMLSITNQGTSPSGGNGLSQLDQQASQLMDALNDLSAAQARVEKDTAEVRDEMRARNADEMRAQLEPFLEEQRAHLDAIADEVDEVDDRDLNDRDRAAIAEIERALESARRLLELEDVEGMRPVVDRLAERADEARSRFMTSRMSLRRSDPARAAYPPSIDGAERIEDEAEQIKRNIDNLLREARPEPSDEELARLEELAGDQQQIEQTGEQLRQQIEQAGEDFPQLEQLAPQMQNALGYMEQSEQRLQGGAVPDALESERQTLRSLRTMKQQLQRTVERQRQKEQQGQDGGEKVEIPESDRRPKAFHEELMEAMKQPGLQGYEDENSLYYKSLVE